VHRVGVTALALSLVTGLGGIAAASAAPSSGHHVFPSKQQVHDARHQAQRAADDVAGVKAQLVRALRQEPAEGAKRMRAMRRYLAKNDLEHWATSFFDALRAQAEGRAGASA